MAPPRLTLDGLTKAYGDLLPGGGGTALPVLAAVVVTAVLSVTLFALTHVVQRLLVPWYRPDHRRG